MNYWQNTFSIGSLKFPRFIGGPLDGITDSNFRKLVREFSTDELLYTEMRHVASVAHTHGGKRALVFALNERPLAFQITACNEKFLEEACEKILAVGVDIVDMNIGCPAPSITRSGAGSALMADPIRLELILKKLRALLPIPFTVKMRAGFKQKNALDIAKLAQDCGADAIAIHPRLQKEMFAGRPDYELAAAVKKSLTIPVLLSGNVINWKTAQLAYEQTGVDGYLIGRGIWGKPWKLKELREHSLGNAYTIDNATVLTYAVKHLDLMTTESGQKGLYCFRKHLPFYLRGVPTASLLRQKLVVSESIAEVKDTLMNLIG